MRVIFYIGGSVEDKLDKVKNNLAQKLELPRDVVLDLPKIIITGNTEITIENHRGIILFHNDEVKINSRVGAVSIKGYNFEILFLAGETLTLKGKFKSVTYEGNEEI